MLDIMNVFQYNRFENELSNNDYKKLEELSGVKQSIIKKIEKGTSSPQIDTVLKLLAPLGKTLAVVPLENN